MLSGMDTFLNACLQPIREQLNILRDTNNNLNTENGLLLAQLDHKQRLLDMYEDRIHELDQQLHEEEQQHALTKAKLELQEKKNYNEWAAQAIEDFQMEDLASEWRDENTKMIERYMDGYFADMDDDSTESDTY